MAYEPREGVDYIVDLYQLAAVPQDAATDEVRQALNVRALEYYPDRLEGLAPEFRVKGERVARLLNRARAILLDDKKRDEYNAILSEWEGPVSTDGTPVISMDGYLRAQMINMTPEEIDAAFAAKQEQVKAMVNYNPRQQSLLGRMFASAEGSDAEELREAYDNALFAKDQLLAIEATDRGQLLGLPADGRYETSLGYVEKVALAIEGARTEQREQYKLRTLGGVSTRLALLAGEEALMAEPSTALATTDGLPHYFDAQAERVIELASQREELLKKRLEIFQPTYPIAEVQTEAHSDFVVGVTTDEASSAYTWLGFTFDTESVSVNNVKIPQAIQELLDGNQFAEVYRQSHNILTFTTKELIEVSTLLEEACNKHLHKYFPEQFA